MLGELKLGEQDRQHWRCALPSPPRTSFNVLRLMSYVPPMCGWMDGPDGLSLWTSNQFRTHGILSQRYYSSGRRCARSHISMATFHTGLLQKQGMTPDLVHGVDSASHPRLQPHGIHQDLGTVGKLSSQRTLRSAAYTQQSRSSGWKTDEA